MTKETVFTKIKDWRSEVTLITGKLPNDIVIPDRDLYELASMLVSAMPEDERLRKAIDDHDVNAIADIFRGGHLMGMRVHLERDVIPVYMDWLRTRWCLTHDRLRDPTSRNISES